MLSCIHCFVILELANDYNDFVILFVINNFD